MKTGYVDTESTQYTAMDTEAQDTKTFGDILAVFLLGSYTLTALIISSWSAVLYYTGNSVNDGPVGFLFKKILLDLVS